LDDEREAGSGDTAAHSETAPAAIPAGVDRVRALSLIHAWAEAPGPISRTMDQALA